MDRIRNTAARFQLGFIALLLACRIVAAAADSVETQHRQADPASVMGSVAAQS